MISVETLVFTNLRNFLCAVFFAAFYYGRYRSSKVVHLNFFRPGATDVQLVFPQLQAGIYLLIPFNFYRVWQKFSPRLSWPLRGQKETTQTRKIHVCYLDDNIAGFTPLYYQCKFNVYALKNLFVMYIKFLMNVQWCCIV